MFPVLTVPTYTEPALITRFLAMEAVGEIVRMPEPVFLIVPSPVMSLVKDWSVGVDNSIVLPSSTDSLMEGVVEFKVMETVALLVAPRVVPADQVE
jgi:hypothetical protein